MSSISTSTSTRGRCAGKAPRLRRRTRDARGVLLLFLAAASSCAGLGRRGGLLEVLEAELWLSGSSRSDRRPNCLRRSCRIRRRSFSISACAASRSARTVSRSISRASILERHGNDFMHTLQLL